MCTYMYTYIHVYTHIHIYIHICIHVYKYISSSTPVRDCKHRPTPPPLRHQTPQRPRRPRPPRQTKAKGPRLGRWSRGCRHLATRGAGCFGPGDDCWLRTGTRRCRSSSQNRPGGILLRHCMCVCVYRCIYTYICRYIYMNMCIY